MNTLEIMQRTKQCRSFRFTWFDHEFILIIRWSEFCVNCFHQKMDKFNVIQNVHNRYVLQVIKQKQYDFGSGRFAIENENDFREKCQEADPQNDLQFALECAFEMRVVNDYKELLLQIGRVQIFHSMRHREIFHNY